MDKQAKSAIPSPNLSGPQYAKVLGGLPPTKSAEEVRKVNNPGARSAAPGSFRPSERTGGDNEKE